MPDTGKAMRVRARRRQEAIDMSQRKLKDRVIAYASDLPIGKVVSVNDVVATIGGRAVTSDRVARIFAGYCSNMEFLPDKPNVKGSGGKWRKMA